MDNDKMKFYPGQIVRHYKRDFLSVREQQENKYLYKVLEIATHTETNEEMMVYQALYPPFRVFCRSLAMCYDKVDDNVLAIQKHRFEPWVKEENIYGKD